MTKLNWDEYERDESVVVDDSLYLDEEEEHDTDVDVPKVVVDQNLYSDEKKSNTQTDNISKESLYKRVLNKINKKTVLGTALASLVLAPISEQKEPRDFSQRQPELEQLLDSEKEILQMPVRVKRELKLNDIELYGAARKIPKGPRGFEAKEEDCLFARFKFEHYGLRNRKLILKQKIEPIGEGQVRTKQHKTSYSESGPAESGVVMGCNLPSGNYLLKSTIEEPKSGLSTKRIRRLRVIDTRPKLAVESFSFCNPISHICKQIPTNRFPIGSQINFTYTVRRRPIDRDFNLSVNYRIRGPNGNIVLEVDPQKNFYYNAGRLYFANFKDEILTDQSDVPGNYTLELIVKNTNTGEEINPTKKFTLY